MAELSRFDWLRKRTEKQLVQLMNHELDRGIHDARQALRSDETTAVAGPYRRAEKAFAEVSLLIPLVTEISEAERRAMESRLEDLGAMLGRVREHESESDHVCLAC